MEQWGQIVLYFNYTMKYIVLILFSVLFFSIKGYSQYPKPNQTIGTDSNVVQAKGGLQGRVINITYVDTTAANLQRIKDYPGAQVFTTSDNKFWLRNATSSSWIEPSGTIPTWQQTLATSSTLNTSNTIDGGNFTFQFHNMGGFGLYNDAGSTTRLKVTPSTTNLFAPDGGSGATFNNNDLSLSLNDGTGFFGISSSFSQLIVGTGTPTSSHLDMTEVQTALESQNISNNNLSSVIGDISGIPIVNINASNNTFSNTFSVSDSIRVTTGYLKSMTASGDTTTNKALGINPVTGAIVKMSPSSFGGSTSVNNSNVGSGYRWLLPGTQVIKTATVASPSSIAIDSSTANQLNFQLTNDANTDSTYYGNLGGKGWKFSAIINLAGGIPGQVVTYLGGTSSFGLTTISTSLTVGTSPITSGGAQRVLYESSSNKLAETAGFTFDGTNVLAIPTSGQYQINTTPVAYLPDQSTFTNSLFYGVKPAALSHGGGGFTGQFNTAVGIGAGNGLIQGQANTLIGSRSGNVVTNGTDNTFVGEFSGAGTGTGSRNTAVGSSALANNTTTSFNTALGYQTLQATTASSNTGLGYQAGNGNSSGTRNTYIGVQSGFNQATGTNNVIIGDQAGVGVASNNYSNNTYIGQKAGFVNTTGSNNIFLGFQAGDAHTTGSNNIVIGYDIDAPSNTGNSQLTIGNAIFGTGITGTGTTAAGNIGILTNAPREVFDVNGITSIRNVPSTTDVDSIVSMTNGRLNSVNLGSGGVDLTQYFRLLGRSGGQSAFGGTAANDVLSFYGNTASSSNTDANPNIQFFVGNSGATTAMTLYNSGKVYIKQQANNTTRSSAGTLTLDLTGTFWHFTGTTTTWTLPPISGYTGVTYYLKNMGSGNITLNSNAGSNDIYDVIAVNTLTIAPGVARIIINDGSVWAVH